MDWIETPKQRTDVAYDRADGFGRVSETSSSGWWWCAIAAPIYGPTVCGLTETRAEAEAAIDVALPFLREASEKIAAALQDREAVRALVAEDPRDDMGAPVPA